ncbi:MAG: LLM class flavin-dependent oxidoreductase [Bacteroidota bacterium]
MEIGVYTFADITADPATGQRISAAERVRNLMEEIELAEQAGLDIFAVGEHHRPDFVVSSPAIILAAAAVKTKRIRLSSAVSVLSSDDPVRVFQDFATVDLLSAGRAEIMAGRGSFIESFPLFGYDLKDYDELFEEKLQLLVQLNEQEKISWKGKHRPAIHNLGVYPRPFRQKLPIWVAVGGTPESVVRAGVMGLPMALAIIGGMPDRFVPLVDLYRSTAKKAGQTAIIGINSQAYIAVDSQKAADEFYPSYADVMGRIGRERGWPPLSRAQFDYLRSEKGSLVVGSPQQVIDKILYEYELFKHDRFLAQMSMGPMPHASTMRSIELFGTRVAPAVHKAINGNPGVH